jgi:hypothetical protein
MANLTDNEARALIYFAIGVTSEGSDRSYQLAFAGNIKPDEHGVLKMYPKGNSGYSIGTLQTDLGQHHEAAAPLTDAFQQWAKANHPDWVLSDAQRTQTIADLSRDGNTIRAQDRRPMDATVKSHLDQFLVTDAGMSFVHQHDVEQTGKLMDKVVTPLRNTELYKHASAEDQAKLIAITAKAYNQSEVYGGRILKHIQDGTYHNVGDVSGAVDHLPDYMQSGRDDALRGTHLFEQLQQAPAGHPLKQAWDEVKANPTVNPTGIARDSALSHEYAVIRDAFVDPAHAGPMIDAMGKNGSYAKTANGRGFYAEGHDAVVWDRAGKGHALVDGKWSSVDSKDVSFTTNADHTLDLKLKRNGVDERLLHVTHPGAVHNGPAHANHPAHAGSLREHDSGTDVQALQTKLAQLGYKDIHGQPLQPDSHYGASTKQAIIDFQTEHQLKPDGIAGAATLKALDEQARAQTAAKLQPGQLPARLDDPTHPDYTFYLSNRSLVHALDHQHGKTPDAGSDNLASALSVSARAGGLQRIDQLALSDDASALWGIQRQPGASTNLFDQRCKVDTVQGLNTPMEQSGAQWPGAMQRFEEQQSAVRQPQVQAEQEPVKSETAPDLVR